MVPTAQQVRTSLVFGAAGAALVAAWLVTPRPQSASCCAPDDTGDDGMRVTARLTSAKILPGDQHLAVTITAPAAKPQTRPALSLAVVIDRSGSMNGPPLRNAKAAAIQLVDTLAEQDAFSIITYSSGDETVVPIGRATRANKAAARAAIDRIWDDGGTCISCGLTRGASELARSPITGGLRRIVLISDGQANEGVWERDELAQLASNTAARGVSISTVGVGLDFDEVTMIQLANVGHGNYYFVEDTSNLDAMFTRELGGLTATVAADVRLVLTDGPGAHIVAAYGYPMTREGNQVIVPIADLAAGETRKVVLRVEVTESHTGPLAVAAVELDWRRVRDGMIRHATTQAVADIVDDVALVSASVDRDAARAVEQARSAMVLEEATITYEKQGYDAAQRVLRRNIDAVRANKALDPATVQELEGASNDAINGFATQPAPKSTKTVRTKAQMLAH
jgi:Ca-activated chloride channel family protein